MPDPGARCPTASRSPPQRRGTAAAAEATALLLSGARLTDGRTVDVRLGGGRIEAVGTAGSLPPPHCSRVDLSGYLLLPAPAEPHAHGDTALTADAEGPVSYDPRGGPAPGHRGRAAAARPRRHRAALARADRRRARASARWRPCSRPGARCAGSPT